MFRINRFVSASFALAAIGMLAGTGCGAEGEKTGEQIGTQEAPLYFAGQSAHWPITSDHEGGAGKGADINVCYITSGIPVSPGQPAGFFDAVPGSQDESDRIAFAGKLVGWFNNTWGRVADINLHYNYRCGANSNGSLRLVMRNSVASCPTDTDGLPMRCEGPATNTQCPAFGTVCDCANAVIGDFNFCECGHDFANNRCVTTRHTDARCCLGSNADVGYQGANQPTSANINIADPAWPTIAVHELGHVLGFYHETMRADWTYTDLVACNSDADCAPTANDYGSSCILVQPTDTKKHCRSPASLGQVESPTADFDSVMAYNGNCPNSNTNGVANPQESLSAWDVIGAQRVYGKKPGGSLVGPNNLCLNITNGTNGAAIVAYQCTGSNNDTFDQDVTSSGKRLFDANVNGKHECINLAGGHPASGVFSKLISYGCSSTNSNGNEQYQLNNMRLRAMGNMCVAAVSSGAGSQLELRKCDDAAACGGAVSTSLDRWDVYGNGLRLSNTNLCVTFPSRVTRGALPTLTNCSLNSATQSFDFVNGEIHTGTLCLNVFGGKPNEHSKIGLYDGCNNDLPNDAFYLTGALQTMGQCVTQMFSFAGAQTYAADCIPDANGNPTSNQEFDYHWR